MKEIKLGKTEFTGSTIDTDPYIICSFGTEGTGKTRFPLTGPEVIGCIPLERKSYFTIKKDAQDVGKRVLLPKDPDAFIINPRKANMLGAPTDKSEKAKEEAEHRLRQYYRDHVTRVTDAIYGLLEHPDVRILVIDTFGQLCTHIECAVNGFEKKLMKISGKLYADKRESNQEIIDLINSFSPFHKHVILTHKHRDEYKKTGADSSAPTGRLTWEGFRFMGNHSNVVIQHESNPKWNPNSDEEDKQWHFALSIRTCQRTPMLEGPDGYRFLTDDMITFPGLIMAIDPDVDVDTLV